jgi:hypothetical protein
MPAGWSISTRSASSARASPSSTSAIFRSVMAWIEVLLGVAMRLPLRSAIVLKPRPSSADRTPPH